MSKAAKIQLLLVGFAALVFLWALLIGVPLWPWGNDSGDKSQRAIISFNSVEISLQSPCSSSGEQVVCQLEFSRDDPNSAEVKIKKVTGTTLIGDEVEGYVAKLGGKNVTQSSTTSFEVTDNSSVQILVLIPKDKEEKVFSSVVIYAEIERESMQANFKITPEE